MTVRTDHSAVDFAGKQHDEGWRNAEQDIKRQAILVVGLQVCGCWGGAAPTNAGCRDHGCGIGAWCRCGCRGADRNGGGRGSPNLAPGGIPPRSLQAQNVSLFLLESRVAGGLAICTSNHHIRSLCKVTHLEAGVGRSSLHTCMWSRFNVACRRREICEHCPCKVSAVFVRDPS